MENEGNLNNKKAMINKKNLVLSKKKKKNLVDGFIIEKQITLTFKKKIQINRNKIILIIVLKKFG